MHRLIQMIDERREMAGLSGARFAERVGIHESMWSRIRAGQRRPSVAFLQGVARVFPDLQFSIFEYIARGVAEPRLVPIPSAIASGPDDNGEPD